MKRIFGVSFGAVLATTLLSGSPAVAQGAFGANAGLLDAERAPIVEVQARRRPVRTSNRNRRNALTAGALVGAAIVGGAIIANSQPRRRYYDDGYYYGQPGYVPQPSYQPQPYYYQPQPRPYSYGEYYQTPDSHVIETRPYYRRQPHVYAPQSQNNPQWQREQERRRGGYSSVRENDP